MNGQTSKLTNLDRRRRQAVQMRLDGRTLKQIRDQVGLSNPTIIAVHKAYLDGGWEAVALKPRGRPASTTNRTATALPPAALQLLRQPPAAAGTLWDYPAAVRQLATVTSLTTSERKTIMLLKKNGFQAENHRRRATQSRGALQRWMKESFPAINQGAKRAGASVYWAGQTAASQTAPAMLFAHNAQGRFCWLSHSHSNDAEHLIDFFRRLPGHADGPVRLLLTGIAVQQSKVVSHWLQANIKHLQVYLVGESPQGDLANANTAEPEAAPTQTSAPDISTAITQETARSAMSSAMETTTHQTTTSGLSHLQILEAESIHLLREVIAEANKPVMLYSGGKDSTVMLHLAKKAFFPAPLPLPLLQIDTGWNFQSLYEFRDQIVAHDDLELIVEKNLDGESKGINPFSHGASLFTNIMKTRALREALQKHQFDIALTGARRDEEISRAKERVLSYRNKDHRWDPRDQRPELWNLYNTSIAAGESLRAFPLSNWTEANIWQYILKEDLALPSLYFAANRPVLERDGQQIIVDDNRTEMNPGEVPMMKMVRLRSMGCYPLTGAFESSASDTAAVLAEVLFSTTSERAGRGLGQGNQPTLEKNRQEGYF